MDHCLREALTHIEPNTLVTESAIWKTPCLGSDLFSDQTWTGAFHIPGDNLAHWDSSCSVQGVSFPYESFLQTMA